MAFKHTPVLLKESIEYLQIRENGVYVDCTVGGGGHSSEILSKISSNGMVIGLDRDIEAIKNAKKKLKNYSNFILINDNFNNIKEICKKLKIVKVDGIIMDLGVSSFQIDSINRGFSYMNNGPLDMRMDSNQEVTAEYLVNNLTRQELQNILYKYGEEKWAGRISNNIIEFRKIERIKTTGQLVNIVKESIPYKATKGRGHPAKKTFQSLRIAVNDELSILEKTLNDNIDLLSEGARLAIITFHSLEDRIIKKGFKYNELDCICQSSAPICNCDKKPKIKIITKKPIIPSETEMKMNPRSKSAKLRVVERI